MPKSLKVHRNTLERRHRKQMQADMVAAARNLGTQDIAAYALVAVKADGRGVAIWDTGSALPMWAFSSTIEKILDDDIRESGVEETWKPSLSERKGLTG